MASDPLLTPLGLAEKLEQWALRREKCLALLDLRGARRARDLADTCRAFATWHIDCAVSDLERELVWLEIRERVVHWLRDRAQTVRASEPAGQSSGIYLASPPVSGADDQRRAS